MEELEQDTLIVLFTSIVYLSPFDFKDAESYQQGPFYQ